MDPGKDYFTKRCGWWLVKVGDDGIREDTGQDMTSFPLGLCECNSDDDTAAHVFHNNFEHCASNIILFVFHNLSVTQVTVTLIRNAL